MGTDFVTDWPAIINICFESASVVHRLYRYSRSHASHDAYSISFISSSIALHSHSSISLKSQLHSFLQPEEAPPTLSSPYEEQISAKTQKPTSSSPAASSISSPSVQPSA
ncbi:ARM repeat superfamily protein [Prunus dulcis]|uniref:ARM repeat superfamily protein n=1 Tax=Prunus dulcis TaxID=3755 RepID=A0A5H2Y7E9_PRUDU|nr:ARM repeat superfamily protein [Prunus dulcis]